MSIKIFKPDSIKSKIPIEVIDERVWNVKNPNQCIKIEIDEPDIDLPLNESYTINLYKQAELKYDNQIVAINSKSIFLQLNKQNEKKFQTITSKEPFKIILLDLNSNVILEGLFYRYKSKKMIGKSKNFASSFNQIYDHSISTLSAPKLLSPFKNSFSSQIKYLKTSSQNSSTVHDLSFGQSSIYTNKFDLYSKNGFLDNYKLKENTNLDNSSSDDEYEFAITKNNIFTDSIENHELFKITKDLTTSFSSIESLESLENRFSEVKFYSFNLKIADSNESGLKKLKQNIYVYETDKLFIANHAIRFLISNYNIKTICSFKLEDNIYNRNKLNYESDLADLLLNGIECDTRNDGRKTFVYIGHSNSGIREKNFWAIDLDSYAKLNYSKFVQSLGDFFDFSSIQTLSKRLSQFYSSSIDTVCLNRTEFVTIDDDLTRDQKYLYTDGIGLIRKNLCQVISEKLKLDYTCFIFQIRFAGYKGLLVGMNDLIFDNILEKNNIHANEKIKCIFRTSQKKFESHELCLNIVAWPQKITKPASLNQEFLMVLDGLDNLQPNLDLKKNLIDLYEKNLNNLEASLTDPKKAYSKLFNCEEGITDFVIKYSSIILACKKDLRTELDPKQYDIIKNILIESNLFNSIIKKKLNIPITKSRYLIGILDESNTLESNEIYVSYRDSNNQVHYLNGVDCIIARTPCYSLSEVQKVKTKFVPELKHLENCIAFSKKGDRPLINLLSGGDLDGDFYFVSWDEMFSSIENFHLNIEYPKKEVENNTRIKPATIRTSLVDYYINSCFKQDNIGLWHYYLICLYDKSRESMLNNTYLDAVIEINKNIDSIQSKLKQTPFVKKPDWYFSREELNEIEKEKNKSIKFNNLINILKYKLNNFNEANYKDYSLLSYLMFLSFKKFIHLHSIKSSKGSFLDKTDIDLLLKDNLICINKLKLEENNFELIKQEYFKFLNKINNLEKCRKDTDLYKGVLEKQLISNFGQVSINEQEKCKLIKEFRNFVFNLKYFDNEDSLDESLKLSIHSPTGFYTNSRVVGLYLKTIKQDCFYQIPWMFYDVLCYLKNYCNNVKYSKQMPNSTPISLSYDLIRFFSLNKLLNYEQE